MITYPCQCICDVCDPLRAEVERLTRERDEVVWSRDHWLARCDANRDAAVKAEAECDALKAALRDMREHHCSCDFKEMDEDCWTCNRAREALGEVES